MWCNLNFAKLKHVLRVCVSKRENEKEQQVSDWAKKKKRKIKQSMA